jgi:catechol 2,3-dioxygenase-like lactoylglutathione lyase family enzyme
MPTAIHSTIPVLASLEMAESVRFYVEQLGFEQRQYLENQYAIVSRDGAEIHFWACSQRLIAENTSCYLRVADVDALYREFLGRGVRLDAPQDREWDMRELYVIDPHGNLLKFGQPVSAE